MIPTRTTPRVRFLALLVPLLWSAGAWSPPLVAQERLSADDYAHAERFLARNTAPLMVGSVGSVRWLDDGRLWYPVSTGDGQEFVIVDPARGEREQGVDADALDPGTDDTEMPPNSVRSPDGRLAAYLRDHDLWVRDLETGDDRPLTTDGVEDFGYATNNAGWTRGPAPLLAWSPDSRRIFTFQQDARGVGHMYLVRTRVGAPELQEWRYPLPQDSVPITIQRVVIDVETADVVRLDMPPDPQRSTIYDHIAIGGRLVDVEWFPDGSSVAFVSTSRDAKVVHLRVADARTGEVRTVLTERSETQFQSGFVAMRRVNWRVLPESNQVLWWSQRDNWGHLYLYDLESGELEHPITTGEWNVTDVLHVDPETRSLYVMGVGREADRHPYFQHFYRVSMDDGAVDLLTPEDATHSVALSPDATHFVDTHSTPVTPPTTVLRRIDGDEVLTLERANIDRLEAAGWQPPTPITVKARDGETDLYGLLFTPTELDPARRYPIVNYIYPGPWGSSVGSWGFSTAHRDHQALAELGFVVVAINGMGTELRSREFQDFYYGDMGDNTIPDQIAGMRQLARERPYIDIERAGIWGHSGGGFATASAMFRHPEFFKVGVSQAGNHDNRGYVDAWSERFQGLLRPVDDGDSYESQANHLVAGNLQGKLLLAHGAMDDNVSPYNTYLVVDALIEANKDFDLIVFPQARHGFGADDSYMMRRRWDYFVEHLLGVDPPEEYRIGGP